jgi:hypothetical protein
VVGGTDRLADPVGRDRRPNGSRPEVLDALDGSRSIETPAEPQAAFTIRQYAQEMDSMCSAPHCAFVTFSRIRAAGLKVLEQQARAPACFAIKLVCHEAEAAWRHRRFRMRSIRSGTASPEAPIGWSSPGWVGVGRLATLWLIREHGLTQVVHVSFAAPGRSRICTR